MGLFGGLLRGASAGVLGHKRGRLEGEQLLAQRMQQKAAQELAQREEKRKQGELELEAIMAAMKADTDRIKAEREARDPGGLQEYTAKRKIDQKYPTRAPREDSWGERLFREKQAFRDKQIAQGKSLEEANKATEQHFLKSGGLDPMEAMLKMYELSLAARGKK